MDTLDTRELFKHGQLTIRARMVVDEDSRPGDADCYDAADVDAWKEDRWQYVGLLVSVSWDGVAIAEDNIWGTEHGYLGSGAYVNAMSMAGTLGDVVDNALGDALMWARKAEATPIIGELAAATDWHASHAQQG